MLAPLAFRPAIGNPARRPSVRMPRGAASRPPTLPMVATISRSAKPSCLVTLLACALPAATVQQADLEVTPVEQRVQEQPTGEALPAALEAERSRFIDDVLLLAQQAREATYHSAARALFEYVCSLEPDNATANKGLGRRKRKGEWQPGRERPAEDAVDATAIEAHDTARAALVERAIEHIASIFEPLPRTPTMLERERQALTFLTGFEPDHEALRQRIGEVRDADSGRWVLEEVPIARRNIAANYDVLAEVRAGLPSTSPGEPDDDAAATSVTFATVLQSEALHVATTLAGSEAQSLHDTIVTAQRYLARFFDSEPEYVCPDKVVSLSDALFKHAFFAEHPAVDPETLDDNLALNGAWIGQQLVVSGPTETERLDMASFLTTTGQMLIIFGREDDTGWIRQSLTSYLSAAVCGTHLSFLVTRDQYGQSGRPWPARVPTTRSGWLEAARPFLGEDQPFGNFVRALGVPTRGMGWEEVAVGYALSVYLCEARRTELFEILRRFEKGDEKMGVLEEVLQIPLPALRTRLARWIDELDADD